MSHFHKSKRYDLIEMFNDTLTIYLLSITMNLKNKFLKIYPTELLLNKPNTSDKETSFLDLNINVIGSAFIPAFTTNAMTPDFL